MIAGVSTPPCLIVINNAVSGKVIFEAEIYAVVLRQLPDGAVVCNIPEAVFAHFELNMSHWISIVATVSSGAASPAGYGIGQGLCYYQLVINVQSDKDMHAFVCFGVVPVITTRVHAQFLGRIHIPAHILIVRSCAVNQDTNGIHRPCLRKAGIHGLWRFYDTHFQS